VPSVVPPWSGPPMMPATNPVPVAGSKSTIQGEPLVPSANLSQSNVGHPSLRSSERRGTGGARRAR
jgi:hypothetical protein